MRGKRFDFFSIAWIWLVSFYFCFMKFPISLFPNFQLFIVCIWSLYSFHHFEGWFFKLWQKSYRYLSTKQFSIESISGVIHPFRFGKNGEFFLRNTNDKVLLFDASTQELKKLEIKDLYHFRVIISLHTYVESLFRINGIQEVKKHIIHQPVEDTWNGYWMRRWMWS